MKRWISLLLMMLFVSGIASAEMRQIQITATGPTSYTDGSVIPAEKRPNILYRCYQVDGAGNVIQTLSQNTGTASCGGNVDMIQGTTYYFTMDCELDGLRSEKAAPKSYVWQPTPPVPAMATAAPGVLTIGNDNVLRWGKPSAYMDGSPVDTATLDRFAYYVFAQKPDSTWQYIGQTPDGGGGELFQLPGQWWVNNVNAGGFPVPLPTPGSTYTFTVATRHFVGGSEYVSAYANSIAYTFPSVTEPPKPPGVPVILDVVAQIQGVTYTVRLEGTAYPKEGN